VSRFRKLRFEEHERGWTIHHSLETAGMPTWRKLEMSTNGLRGLANLPPEKEYPLAWGPPDTVDAGRFMFEKLEEEHK